MNVFIKVIATGFGSGYLKPAPGTWGTLTGLVIAWFWQINLIWIFVLSLLGVVICQLGEKVLKEHDSPKIVFDEMVGIWISVWNIPFLLYPVAFVLFRFFDITKFFPIDNLQKIPGGWGIMLDDIAAGIISRILLGIILLIFF